jgi:MFS family permease
MFVIALTGQDGLHEDALHSGLAIAPLAVTFLIGSLLTPRLIERLGGRATLGWGAVLQAVGLSLLGWTVAVGWPHVALLDMAPGLLVAGFGQAMVFGSLFRLILADVPPHLAGIGGGVLVTLQQSGLALGVATLGTLYLGLDGGGTGFGTVLGIQAGLALVMAIASRGMPSLAHRPAVAAEA